MDRWTFFVASAHVRLRLEYLACHPELWTERTTMTPNFLGLASALHVLRHNLEDQSAPLLADISDIASRSGAAMREARSHVASAKAGIADLEAFNAAMRGSNGGPSLDGSSTSSGESSTNVSGDVLATGSIVTPAGVAAAPPAAETVSPAAAPTSASLPPASLAAPATGAATTQYPPASAATPAAAPEHLTVNGITEQPAV
jgi:hypothetical protein